MPDPDELRPDRFYVMSDAGSFYSDETCPDGFATPEAAACSVRSPRSGREEPAVWSEIKFVARFDNEWRGRGCELREGDWLVDGDAHLWRVVGVAPGSVTLAGRATEQEFEVAPDGSVVSDREFSRVEVEICDHGYVEGEGCPKCDADGESFDSYRSYSDSL